VSEWKLKPVPTAKPFFLLIFLLAGCGNTTPPSPERGKTALPEGHVDPVTAGTITGRILFHGTPPVMPVIDMSSNPSCQREHKGQVRAQTVVVNSNGTLRNAFVWIKSGLPPAHWSPPAETVKLAQNGCIYEPHVEGIMVGQQLEILNDDPVNHNVHAESQINAAWNISEPPRAEHSFRKFTAPEVLIPVSCSVHPWMRSYLGVVPHPFFAVSGEDGTFTIPVVPPGTYTIEVVHEKLGKKEGTVTLTPGGSATLDFTYGI